MSEVEAQIRRQLRGLPPAINGTEQRLDALLDALQAIAELLQQAHAAVAALEQVKDPAAVTVLQEPVQTSIRKRR